MKPLTTLMPTKTVTGIEVESGAEAYQPEKVQARSMWREVKKDEMRKALKCMFRECSEDVMLDGNIADQVRDIAEKTKLPVIINQRNIVCLTDGNTAYHLRLEYINKNLAIHNITLNEKVEGVTPSPYGFHIVIWGKRSAAVKISSDQGPGRRVCVNDDISSIRFADDSNTLSIASKDEKIVNILHNHLSSKWLKKGSVEHTYKIDSIQFSIGGGSITTFSRNSDKSCLFQYDTSLVESFEERRCEKCFPNATT